MAVVPGGDELVVRSDSTVHTYARDMSSRTSFDLPTTHGFLVAGEQFLYVTESDNKVSCLTYAGTEVARSEDHEKIIICPILAPGGLLFCVLFDEEDPEQDEIVALDAQTLQPRYRFGLSLLDDVSGMVVVDEELFVCDTANNRIQVFSLTGEHRRSITGEWKRPGALCLVKDRLYLIEESDDEEDEKGEPVNPLCVCGRRIFVLSLQGETLQVYTNPVEGQFFGDTLCCFDGKLLAPVRSGGSNIFKDMVALCGV